MGRKKSWDREVEIAASRDDGLSEAICEINVQLAKIVQETVEGTAKSVTPKNVDDMESGELSACLQRIQVHFISSRVTKKAVMFRYGLITNLFERVDA